MAALRGNQRFSTWCCCISIRWCCLIKAPWQIRRGKMTQYTIIKQYLLLFNGFSCILTQDQELVFLYEAWGADGFGCSVLGEVAVVRSLNRPCCHAGVMCLSSLTNTQPLFIEEVEGKWWAACPPIWSETERNHVIQAWLHRETELAEMNLLVSASQIRENSPSHIVPHREVRGHWSSPGAVLPQSGHVRNTLSSHHLQSKDMKKHIKTHKKIHQIKWGCPNPVLMSDISPISAKTKQYQIMSPCI